MVIKKMITASMLYDHIACSHKVVKDTFSDPDGRDNVSPFAQLLWDRGNIHENELINSLEIKFLDLSDHPAETRETLTRTAMSDQVTLIYGGRISYENLLGDPDLLRYESYGYVAGDIKSGSAEESGSRNGRQKKATWLS